VSRPAPSQPVKLIASLLTAEHELALQVGSRLASRFGPLDFTSPALPFAYTSYYEAEIGPNLVRYLVSFEALVAPDRLPAIKLYTNEVEDTLLRADRTRRINIDPGYIALCHMVLATCKAFAHRPYLRDGVYADMTLIFQDKTFRPLAWTFPDYRSPELVSTLNQIRQRYHQQLQAPAPAGIAQATNSDTSGR